MPVATNHMAAITGNALRSLVIAAKIGQIRASDQREPSRCLTENFTLILAAYLGKIQGQNPTGRLKSVPHPTRFSSCSFVSFVVSFKSEASLSRRHIWHFDHHNLAIGLALQNRRIKPKQFPPPPSVS